MALVDKLVTRLEVNVFKLIGFRLITHCLIDSDHLLIGVDQVGIQALTLCIGHILLETRNGFGIAMQGSQHFSLLHSGHDDALLAVSRQELGL